MKIYKYVVRFNEIISSHRLGSELWRNVDDAMKKRLF